MNKREQKFTTECKKWCIYNIKTLGIKKGEALIIECKVSIDNKPFNYKSGFKPHQLPDLIRAKKNVWGYKPSDASMSFQLCDLIIGNQTKAYVAIKWIRHGNKKFYLIDPDVIQGRIDDGKKSLTEEEANNIADIIGEIGTIN